MATRNEKLFGSLTGAVIGGVIGYLLSENKEIGKKNHRKYILGGAALGGAGGYGAALLLGTKNDTINYQLIQGKQKVYHGITYEDRVLNREQEHIKSGKIFSEMIIDFPKPRVDAISLEKKLIKKDRPKYNIQHNRKVS